MTIQTYARNNSPERAGRYFANRWLAQAEDREIDDLLMTLGRVPEDIELWANPETSFYNTFIPLEKPICNEESQFLIGFFNELLERHAIRREALRHQHHSMGIVIGKKWAKEYATDEELENIVNFLSGPYDCELTANTEHEMWVVTVSHHLLNSITNSCDFDDPDGIEDPLSEAYFNFWNKLLDKPVKKENYERIVTPSHPLRSSFFMIGFIDGALGISDQLT